VCCPSHCIGMVGHTPRHMSHPSCANLSCCTQQQAAHSMHISRDQPLSPISLCISTTSGGLRGYFVCGAAAVLQASKQRIGRISGASAGAWCAVFMACGLGIEDWARTWVLPACVIQCRAGRPGCPDVVHHIASSANTAHLSISP